MAGFIQGLEMSQVDAKLTWFFVMHRIYPIMKG